MVINMKSGFSAAVVCALVFATPQQAHASGQQVFASPEAAGTALIAADRAEGPAKLLGVLGADATDLISSGDPVADARGRRKFAAAYEAKHAWRDENKDTKVLVVGFNDWTLPIPLVRGSTGWRFDTKAGRQEILDRRVSHNESKVVATCRAIVVAEHEFADLQKTSGKRIYADRLMSSPGHHDGLFWPVGKGEKESPLGPFVAQAADEGYPSRGKAVQHAPFHGYYYRILKAQGSSAPGGSKSYYDRGGMTRGFALLAYPAKYGVSGMNTYLVDQTGIVYEKDLGTHTPSIVAQMTRFNPDDSWKIPQAVSLNE
jgi:hypothetical protein